MANGGTALAQAQTAGRTSHCIEAHMFSLRNHTKLFSKTDDIEVTMDFSRLEFDVDVSPSFKISSKYKRIY